jgi:hypothetical protein
MAIISIFKHALMISFFVFVMMLLVDFIDTASKKRMSEIIKGGRWRQYTLASFFGATPGCLGAFMNVSLYMHGMISLGAIAGGMIATSGDEAFVMLAQFPATALGIFFLLFVLGIFFAWVTDHIAGYLKIKPCATCYETTCMQCDSDLGEQRAIDDILHWSHLIKNFQHLSFTRFLFLSLIGSFLLLVSLGSIGPPAWGWERITFIALSIASLYIAMVVSEHYLHAHIWNHIIKRHVFRVFLWSFGALLFIDWGRTFLNLEGFIHQNMIWVLVTGALLGIIPESGPHLLFVMMYAQGLVPLSVLFTSSFVQDGHGMLPLLSYSIRDSLIIKLLNLVFGLAVGMVLFTLGR